MIRMIKRWLFDTQIDSTLSRMRVLCPPASATSSVQTVGVLDLNLNSVENGLIALSDAKRDGMHD